MAPVDIVFLFKGIVLGVCISAPTGPIGVICIRRTLHYGRLSGFFSGLGASIADTLFGAASAFGLTLVSDFIDASRFWLLILGGFFLCFLGGKTFFAKPVEEAAHLSQNTSGRLYLHIPPDPRKSSHDSHFLRRICRAWFIRASTGWDSPCLGSVYWLALVVDCSRASGGACSSKNQSKNDGLDQSGGRADYRWLRSLRHQSDLRGTSSPLILRW